VVAYFDTSYLVKLFLPETGTDRAKELLAAANVISTSLISYAEMGSALARQKREGWITEDKQRVLMAEFRDNWVKFNRIGISEQLVARASELADIHSLKGADSIHLASALQFAKAGRGIEVLFATADERLRKGAVMEGLAIPAEYSYEGGKPGTAREKKVKWGKGKKK